jgi:hypothetical protein
MMVQDFPPVDDERAARAARKAQAKSAVSPIARVRNWLVDSYNGLFKIVIQPQLPKPKMLLILTLVFVFGLIWAYVIMPVQFFDAGVHQLSPNQRNLYLILVAGSYEAGFYEPGDIVNLLRQVENPAGAIQQLINQQSGIVQASLQQILPLAEQAGAGTPAPASGDIVGEILMFVVAVVVFIIAINVISLLWGLLIGGFVERFMARFKPETDADRSARATIEEIRRRKGLEEQLRQEVAVDSGNQFGPPVMQRVSTYIKGRNFDDSFAIEDANDMFLGECGATIARTIGDTQELAAVEIWLFDKEDFVRTLTKIFVSEHAFNDPVIRSELEPKVENPATDIVIAAPGASIVIETNAILLQARIADVQMGSGPLPPNSYFEGLTIHMQAWEKSGAAVPAGAPAAQPMGAASGLPPVDSYEIGPPPAIPQAPPQSPPQQVPPPMPAYDPPQRQQPPAPEYNPPPSFQPPPQQQPPAPEAPPGGDPLRPFQPPPRQQPPPPAGFPGEFDDEEDEDDDPFGGTADFTPIGNN